MKPTLDQIRGLCSTDEGRKDIANPFHFWVEGKQYVGATNGHVAIAVQETDFPDGVEPAPGKIPTTFGDAVREARSASRPITVGEIRAWIDPLPPDTECSTCDGAGTDADCDVCDGRGSHDWPDCEADHDCGNCNGVGGFKICPECNGRGKHRPRALPARVVDGVYVDRLLVRDLLAALPADTVDVLMRWTDGKAWVLFTPSKDDAWVGIVMPMRFDVGTGGDADTRPKLFFGVLA